MQTMIYISYKVYFFQICKKFHKYVLLIYNILFNEIMNYY